MSSPSSSSRADLLPPEEAWAGETAASLRLILATGADESPAQREAVMLEHVRRSLHTVAPAQRARHLECLRAHFPTGIVASPAPASSEPARGPTAPQAPEDVLRIVLEAWSRFSPEQRKALQEQLTSAGVAPAAGGGDAGASGEVGELRKAFGLAPNETLNLQRLGKLAVQQFEFLAKLDQLGWGTWKQIAPRSGIKRDTSQGDVRQQARRYLRGDPEPGDLQVAQQIEVTRQLVATLIGSMSQVGKAYAKRFQMRYAPEAIKDAVVIEGGAGGFFQKSLEGRCWAKYIELAGEVNEATIQTEMLEVVVKYVEDIVGRNKARPGS